MLLVFANFFFRLVWFSLQVLLKLLIFILIFLESVSTFVKFLLLHNYVLFKKFCFLGLVIYANLSHQDLPRIQNEISNKLFLLPGFDILQGFYLNWIVTAGAWKLRLCFRNGYLIQSNPRKCFMLQHSWVLRVKYIKLPIVCIFRVLQVLRLIILLDFF